MIKVIGTKACGSVIAEAFLTWANLPFEHVEVDYDAEGPGKELLLSKNSLGQVPTLILADGQILTETLAVAAYANNAMMGSLPPLIPESKKDFVRYWRWATMIVTAVYPTFTYGDAPEKWAGVGEGAKFLRTATDKKRMSIWQQFEGEATAPYFLGESFSAIDIYIFVMTHWRPGAKWFQDQCPKLWAIRNKISELPQLQPLWKLNFEA